MMNEANVDDIIDEEDDEQTIIVVKKRKKYVPLAERESPSVYLRRFMRKRNKELDISEKFKKID